jgi:3D (Asp-Asp-Asp) domain-containing protein
MTMQRPARNKKEKGDFIMSIFAERRLIPLIHAACLVFASLALSASCFASPDIFKITAYCSCQKCCGKSDGIPASGKKIKYGYVACNWLAFGTKIKIENLGIFEVQDRGAKSLFGSKTNHIKHLDVYLPSHQQARIFGVKYLKVQKL